VKIKEKIERPMSSTLNAKRRNNHPMNEMIYEDLEDDDGTQSQLLKYLSNANIAENVNQTSELKVRNRGRRTATAIGQRRT
jgi:hypothetical protein